MRISKNERCEIETGILLRDWDFKVFFPLFLICLGSSIKCYQTSNEPLSKPLLLLFFLLPGVGLAIFLLISKGQNIINLKFEKRSPILILWFMFTSALLLGAIWRQELIEIAKSIWLMIIIPFFFFFLLPKNWGNRLPFNLLLAMMVGILPHLILSVLIVPPTNRMWYQGLLGNSNSMGQLSTFSFASALLLMHASVFRSEWNFLLVFIPVALLSLCLVLLSSSLTCLGTILLISVIFMVNLIYCQHNSQIAVRLIVAAGIIVLLLGLFIPEPFEFLTQGINDKVKLREEQGSLIAGRDEIWRQHTSNVPFWGKARKDREQVAYLTDHNNFIAIFSSNGILAGILYALVSVLIIVRSVIYALRFTQYNPYSILPVIMVSVFLMMSITETFSLALDKPIIFSVYVAMGLLIDHETKKTNLIAYETRFH